MNIYEVPDNQALFTNQGGFSVDRPKINIAVQYYGYSLYKVHTIEINNPDQCNINRFTIRRRNSLDHFTDPYELNSHLVDGVPLVDIDFYKSELNMTNHDEIFYRMDIKVLSTRNGANIGKCEFRAFGEDVEE